MVRMETLIVNRPYLNPSGIDFEKYQNFKRKNQICRVLGCIWTEPK